MQQLTFGSLFAGIGGFDLGFERAGMKCLWQVEQNQFCQKILAEHWPNVPKYNDVHEVGKHNLKRVNVICGGFPCQDISDAGKREGLSGERSGLWFEYHRIIRELRPDFTVIENVSALLVRGLDSILCGLAEIGYDAEWQTLSARVFGYPHKRERMFIIGYPTGMFRDVCGDHGGCGQEVFGEVPEFRDDDRQYFQTGSSWQDYKTDILGTPDEFPSRSHQDKAIGNAVMPVIATFIGLLLQRAYNKKMHKTTPAATGCL